MNRRTAGGSTPWPIHDEPGPLWHVPADGEDGAVIGGTATDQNGEAGALRIRQLIDARDQLVRVLVTLDEHSRSPAPATVDLAIHQINRELGF
ncbi:MAG: hypothetical protein JWL91_2311 [Sphingomonas bacterium]|nr:hypothetical protein [Sphingomonas bacterium]MDB5690435.1 hypothetical protein [Sphingomonas bacterium]